MGNLEAFIYGLVQGATEYLPVSSSAHLLLLPAVFGKKDPGLAFDVILHIGTFLATAVYFFSDWVQILKNPFPRKEASQQQISWIHLIIGTLPAVVVGVLLNHWIQEHARSLVVLWFTLPIFGIFLWWSDRASAAHRHLKEVTLTDMFLIGCMQALSLVPGVSRSGSTITAARLRGFTRGDSARISFLLSLPVTLGAIVYEGRHWREVVESVTGFTPLFIACAAALVFGALSIHFLIRYVSRQSYAIFAVYRVVVGLLIMWLL